jgi:hypothetical protein
MRVIGWVLARHRGGDVATPPTPLWVPVPLGEFLCTLSTVVGIAGATAVATDRFCDTIAIVSTSGVSGQGLEIYSPADNTIGHVVLDMRGVRKLEITFTTGSSATSCNALAHQY